MHATGDGFKIVNGESIGIQISIPSDYIERMRLVMVRINVMLFFDVNKKISFLIMRLQLLRLADVALAIGRMFKQLPVLIAVFLRWADRTERL